jgi:methylthioribose-1-phosphate isomerase
MIQALAWKGDYLEILDQTRLPGVTSFIALRGMEEVFEAIQQLKVRGAPAIGVTAAYGLYLGMRNRAYPTRAEFFKALEGQIRHLASARPTAVNLVWALRHVQARVETYTEADVESLTLALLEAARELHEDDRRRCQAIAQHGQQVVSSGARILTHCNSGALATCGMGTALGVIHQAHLLGKGIRVFADETRPVLQGARLTMWELAAAGVPAQLICDNMAAALMHENRVDLVLVGADRIAADGSVANKIGTYGLGVLAKHHGVPFYVAAPLSTFDLTLSSGAGIPIEMRSAEEVRRVFGQTLITLPNADCWNPAFDVTPPELVTAIITERGLIRPPYRESIAALAASGFL